MELLSGSLHQYLVKARTSKHYALPVEDTRYITSQKLMGFAKHIAMGMAYVSSKGVSGIMTIMYDYQYTYYISIDENSMNRM